MNPNNRYKREYKTQKCPLGERTKWVKSAKGVMVYSNCLNK